MGSAMHPCPTPHVTGKGIENSPPILTLPNTLSCSDFKIFVNFSVQPNFRKSSHRPDLLTMSKAFVRSIKTVYRFLCDFWFLCTSPAVASGKDHIVRSAINPHCASGMTSSATVFDSRENRFLGRIFQAMDFSSVMPRNSPQSDRSPFF